MKKRPVYPSRFNRSLALTIGICILIGLALLAFPSADVQGRMPGRNFSLSNSINPDWKHLGITWRVSIASDRAEANGYSFSNNAISPDGRYVAFSSSAYNLVPGDLQYAYEDAFLHDNQTGATERISVSTSGASGNDSTFYGIDISADGRFVVFCSKASNLVGTDTNAKWDVFVRDRQLNTTSRLSVSSTGVQSNGNSWQPRISEDGLIVVYTSEASNLVADDTNNKWDIFAYHMPSGQTERISVSSSEAQGNGDAGDNKPPAVSADGRFVAFTSAADNLVDGDTNNFLRQRRRRSLHRQLLRCVCSRPDRGRHAAGLDQPGRRAGEQPVDASRDLRRRALRGIFLIRQQPG